MRFCESILAHTAGLTRPTVVPTATVYDAILWNIALIGEAATNVPDVVRDAYPEVPWSVIVAARNQIIHRYWRIDSDTVWSIVDDDVPALLQQLRRILRVST